MDIQSRIRSVAHYVPEHRVTNDDLSKVMETSDEWITERTGIKERRFVDADCKGTSELGEKAARLALEKAGWSAQDLDLIVVALAAKAETLVPRAVSAELIRTPIEVTRKTSNLIFLLE